MTQRQRSTTAQSRRALLRLDWRQTWASRKNFVLALLLVLLCGGYFFVAQAQKRGDIETQILHEQDLVNLNATQVELTVPPTSGPAAWTASNLNDQVHDVGRIYVGFAFHSPALARDNWVALAKLRIAGAKQGYPGLQANMGLPSVTAAKRDYALYRALQRRKQPTIGQVRDTASYLVNCLSLFTLMLPLFGLIVASDIWLSSSLHASVTAPLPVSFAAQAGSKLLTRFSFTWGVGALGLLVASAVAAVSGGWGRLDYPVALALGSGFTIVSIAGTVWLVLLCWAVLSLFSCALQLVINLFTRNVYVSLVLGVGLVFLSQALPQGAKWWWWTPLSGLSLANLFAGTVRTASGFNWFGTLPALGVLLLWTVGLLALFRWRAQRVAG